MAEPGALVTIDGTVDVGDRAPYVRARTVVVGWLVLWIAAIALCVPQIDPSGPTL